METKKIIENYWTKRADSFSKLRQSELHSVKYRKWEDEILSQLSEKSVGKVLDVGCGAGFFSILLGKNGYDVTGIDLTQEMISEAKQLARKENVEAEFLVMDAENLTFSDESFDIVISRNLTWNLPNPKKAYKEWLRVLKPGGILLNYDAEYARNHHNQILPKHNAHEGLSDELLQECHKIYHLLDISAENRPAWDMAVLKENGCEDCNVDIHVGEKIYDRQDEFYIPVPMFGIKAVKTGGDLIQRFKRSYIAKQPVNIRLTYEGLFESR